VDIPSWSWLQLRIKLQEIYILKHSFHGMPDEAEEKNFEADDFESEFEDDLDQDDLDMFEGDDSFEDFGFEENWN
jgi:predicted double-glycine peptidase